MREGPPGTPRLSLCAGTGAAAPPAGPPSGLTVPQAADPVHDGHLDDKGEQVVDEGVEGLVGEHAPGEVRHGLELVVDEELGGHGDEACSDHGRAPVSRGTGALTPDLSDCTSGLSSLFFGRPGLLAAPTPGASYKSFPNAPPTPGIFQASVYTPSPERGLPKPLNFSPSWHLLRAMTHLSACFL